ncbi:uncharacterized protein VTP21DRAFT_6658 [Calcarisporiella thermophila]|uniref:uncharacterized protein n=1 Tax=Calcarisporiella thermophila TaxID=911321 RepID=UPI0037434E70
MDKQQPPPPPHTDQLFADDIKHPEKISTDPIYKQGFIEGFEEGRKNSQLYEKGVRVGKAQVQMLATMEVKKDFDRIIQRHIDEKRAIESHYKTEMATLKEKLAMVEQKLLRREQDYIRMESNYLEDKKAIRATDDDLSTIREQFKKLKYSISQMLLVAASKCDRQAATAFIGETFKELIQYNLQNPMEIPFISMFMEKYVMTFLIEEFLMAPLLPGLEISNPYFEVYNWLLQRQPQWATRLRQQITAAAVRDKESQEKMASAAARAADELAAIFMRVYPRWSDNNNKLGDITNMTLQLSIAMRGQEIEIHPLPIKEGQQEFDPEIMEMDAKSRMDSGRVTFCICPPFIGGDGDHGFLEKGKVYLG